MEVKLSRVCRDFVLSICLINLSFDKIYTSQMEPKTSAEMLLSRNGIKEIFEIKFMALYDKSVERNPMKSPRKEAREIQFKSKKILFSSRRKEVGFLSNLS